MKTIEEKRAYWKEKAIIQRKKFIEKYGVHPEIYRRFGMNPKIIFKRDGWKCKECGSEKNLSIDHIDGNGRNKTNKGLKANNKKSNLITLCRVCHGRKDGKKNKTTWKNRSKESREKSLSNLKYWKKNL